MVGGTTRGRGRPPSAARGGGRGRGRPPSACRRGGPGRVKSPSATRGGGGRGRGRTPSAAQGKSRGRGKSPSSTQGGGRGRTRSATSRRSRGRGKSPSATRGGGGCGRGRTPSAAQGKSRGRGKSPSSTQGGVRGRGRTSSATSGGSPSQGKSQSATRGGRGRGRPPNATRGGGRGQGTLKKTVKKHVPAKSSKSKTSGVMNARNASEKSDRGKRKSAVNSLLVNVARQEEINLQNKTPVASPSPSLNKKVSAEVDEEGKGKKKTCTGSHHSFKKCPYQRLTDFGYEKHTQHTLDLPSNVKTMKNEAMQDVSPFKASNQEVEENKHIQSTQEKVIADYVCEDEIEVVKNCSVTIVASIRDIATPNVTISKNDNALVSQESTTDTATQEANIPEIDSALVSQVEDTFTNDTTFLTNKVGISSYISTVPQDNKAPISPAQGAFDLRHNRFKNHSRSVSRLQNSELGITGTNHIQTNASHDSAVIEDRIEVSKVHNISNMNTTVPILNENNAAASQVNAIVTAKVFKASTIHGSKKEPYICHTCSKHYFRKDQFLSHTTDHTRERLRNVKPKRQHEKKCVQIPLSDPVILAITERNMPENEKDQVETTSEQENFTYGNNVEILYDKTEVGTKDKLDATIDLSDDKDISTQSNSIKGDLITAPTLVATSDALSASPIVTHRINPSFGNKISKINTVGMVAINVMDNTIDVSDDEEPVQKCNKKIVKKRQFTYQPLRQNQIPNGGFEKKAEDNPGPINNVLPILNMAKKSGSNCGEALDKIKLLGSAVTLITTTSPCDISRTEEKAAADMRLKETEAVKSAKVGLPHKRATPLTMRETENAVKRLKVCLPLTRATPCTEETVNTLKRIKVCLPQSRAAPPSENTTDFEDENEEASG